MDDSYKELKWFLGALAVIWLVWFFTGGPARYESEQADKPFIKAPTPLDTGETYGPTGYVNERAPKDWTSLPVQRFFGIAVPFGWRIENEQNVTSISYRATLTNGITHLYMDYGANVVPLIPTGDTRYKATYEKISGENAELIRPANSAGTITGTYFSHTPSGARLSISGINLSAQEIQTAFTLFRTIQFFGTSSN